MFRWIVAIVLAGIAAAPAVIVSAQEETAEKTELAELLLAARAYELQVVEGSHIAKLRESPLLNFTNPERSQELGSVFVWMFDNRPVAVGQFFRFNTTSGVRTTKHAFHSLSPGNLTATYAEQIAWAPTAPGLTWRWAEDAPTPAESSSARLLQMRQLSRRFRVTLTNPKGEPTELRLIPRPLLEYAAPEAGLLSGAILSFVIATDPESLLIVEAVVDNGETRYRYAFARFHFQQIVATLGNQEVWRVEYAPSLMRNLPGDPQTQGKIYTSFYR